MALTAGSLVLTEVTFDVSSLVARFWTEGRPPFAPRLTKEGLTEFLPVRLTLFLIERVCRWSFWAVKVLNVFDDAKMFVLEGESVGLMKFD